MAQAGGEKSGPELSPVALDPVTAVRLPEGMGGAKLRRALREEYGVVVAGGQGPFTDKIFRIGHLGFVSEAAVGGVLEALDAVLPRLRA